LIRGRAGESGILYTQSRKSVDSLTEFLRGRRRGRCLSRADAATRSGTRRLRATRRTTVVTIGSGSITSRTCATSSTGRCRGRWRPTTRRSGGRSRRLPSDCPALLLPTSPVTTRSRDDRDLAARTEAGLRTPGCFRLAETPVAGRVSLLRRVDAPCGRATTAAASAWLTSVAWPAAAPPRVAAPWPAPPDGAGARLGGRPCALRAPASPPQPS
jgi:hypothetical protein